MDSKSKSLKVQETFVNESKDIIRKENLVEKLNQSIIEFNENPEYGTFVTIKKTIEELDKTVKEAVKEVLINNNLRSSEGPAGKFTLVVKQRFGYNQEDEKADPRVKRILELQDEIKELEEDVKNDITLFNKEVKGVIKTESPEVRFYKAKDSVKGKALAADFVDGEEA